MPAYMRTFTSLSGALRQLLEDVLEESRNVRILYPAYIRGWFDIVPLRVDSHNYIDDTHMCAHVGTLDVAGDPVYINIIFNDEYMDQIPNGINYIVINTGMYEYMPNVAILNKSNSDTMSCEIHNMDPTSFKRDDNPLCSMCFTTESELLREKTATSAPVELLSKIGLESYDSEIAAAISEYSTAINEVLFRCLECNFWGCKKCWVLYISKSNTMTCPQCKTRIVSLFASNAVYANIIKLPDRETTLSYFRELFRYRGMIEYPPDTDKSKFAPIIDYFSAAPTSHGPVAKMRPGHVICTDPKNVNWSSVYASSIVVFSREFDTCILNRMYNPGHPIVVIFL